MNNELFITVDLSSKSFINQINSAKNIKLGNITLFHILMFKLKYVLKINSLEAVQIPRD